MTESNLASILFVLLLFVGLAQLLGYIFTRLRQPRVIGEIAAGVVLGPVEFEFAGQPAAADDQRPIDGLCDLGEDVARDENGASFGGERPEQIAEPADSLWVERDALYAR